MANKQNNGSAKAKAAMRLQVVQPDSTRFGHTIQNGSTTCQQRVPQLKYMIAR
jgi:hypothetical protein